MTASGKFIGFRLALSVLCGTIILTGKGVPVWATFLLAAVIVAASALVWDVDTVVRRKPPAPAPKPAVEPVDPDKVIPRFGSRRFARAQYAAGLISIEELVSFCASHPIIPNDVDNWF